jgi:hypothetical protein
MTARDEERLLDLLTERVERALSDKERAELDKLLEQHPHWRRNDLDFAAAAIHMALDPAALEMPETVKARLVAQVVGDATRPGPLRLAHTQNTDITSSSLSPQARGKRSGRDGGARALLPYMGWMAAAACLLVAVLVYSPDDGIGAVATAPTRDALIEAPGTITIAWTPTEDALGKNVSGDVVWSGASQAGYMRFVGLPANDPTKAQYQLWIFDAERDERYPVDGGVFDVNANGETVVRIKAAIPVNKATLFAVTLEKPGGVVVSTRERLVALGKVG